jgi:hypothetical protein
MVERKTIPAHKGFDIAIATEQMSDGKWAFVATVKQSTDTAQRNIDLPVTGQRFDSQADAENYAARMAMEWIDQNAPKAA